MLAGVHRPPVRESGGPAEAGRGAALVAAGGHVGCVAAGPGRGLGYSGGEAGEVVRGVGDECLAVVVHRGGPYRPLVGMSGWNDRVVHEQLLRVRAQVSRASGAELGDEEIDAFDAVARA